MVSFEQISDLAQQIGRAFQPTRIVLFGSHAYGEPTADSDVDMLVVIPHKGKSWRMASEIRNRVHPRFPVDLVVRTPEQVNERLALGDCFIEEIVERGKVLYESSDR